MTDFGMIVVFTMMGMALLCIVLSLIFAGIWTYRDARARGLEAGVWVLVVLLVPNFLGILIYALTARRDYRYPCGTCGRSVSARSAYCGSCGAPLNPEEATPPKGGPKGLLVGFFVSLALTFLLMIGAFAGAVVGSATDWFSEGFDFSPSLSTIYIENEWGNKWDVLWHYTNTTPKHTLWITEGGPTVLYYEGSSEEGPLTLIVRQGDVERSFDLSGEGQSGSLDLSIFQSGKVQLILDNDKGAGKGVNFKSYWE